MEKVNDKVLAEIKKLGAFDLEACYSCGTCSAICPLSADAVSFPRRMIRYALLGLEKRILAAPEPWLCYYCGECSDTCPRQAEPAALMMALRRFATRKYSLGRFADAVYSSLASRLHLAAAQRRGAGRHPAGIQPGHEPREGGFPVVHFPRPHPRCGTGAGRLHCLCLSRPGLDPVPQPARRTGRRRHPGEKGGRFGLESVERIGRPEAASASAKTACCGAWRTSAFPGASWACSWPR